MSNWVPFNFLLCHIIIRTGIFFINDLLFPLLYTALNSAFTDIQHIKLRLLNKLLASLLCVKSLGGRRYCFFLNERDWAFIFALDVFAIKLLVLTLPFWISEFGEATYNYPKCGKQVVPTMHILGKILIHDIWF